MGNGRKPCCDKAGVKKGPWSQAEDLKLISFIQKHGHNNWRALPKLAGLARCGKSCRLRWVNYLRPDLKRGNFTLQEEEAIIKLHKAIGNKWSKIASHFPGRTDNEIKNVWNTHLKKRIKAKESSSTSSSSVDPSLNEVQGENNKGCSQEPSIQQTSPVRDETVEHSSSSSTSYSSQASFSSPHLDKGVAHSNMVEIVSKEDDIDIGVNKINEDSLEELIDIPFEPNLDLWDLLDGDSNSFESEVQFMNDQVILEAPSNPTTENDKNYNGYDSTNREDGSSWWWLVYLENELGLVHSDSTPLQTTSGSSEEFWFNKEDVYFQTSPTKFT